MCNQKPQQRVLCDETDAVFSLVAMLRCLKLPLAIVMLIASIDTRPTPTNSEVAADNFDGPHPLCALDIEKERKHYVSIMNNGGRHG